MKTHVGLASTVTPAVSLPMFAPGPAALDPSAVRRTEIKSKWKRKYPETLKAAFLKAKLRANLGSSPLVLRLIKSWDTID